MSAKYCKEKRCQANDGTPCKVADDCDFFKWDIDRQLGKTDDNKKNKKREQENK